MPRGIARIQNWANKQAAWEGWNALAADYPELATKFQPKENAGWRTIDKASKKLREAIAQDEFHRAFDQGWKDMALIMQPVGTNGHTYEEYLRVATTYREATEAFAPTAYQQAYGTGADTCASVLGGQRAIDIANHGPSGKPSDWADFDQPATEAM